MVTDQGLARIQRWMQACIEDQGTCEEAIESERAQSAISAEEARSVVLPSKTLSSLERLDIYRGMYLLRMEEALSAGSGLALASVAFLAVYREGFETILFYKALLTSAGPGATTGVVGGVVVGAAALVLVYIAINRFGLKVPLKPFFAITSAMLYYMAFVFAGKGIAGLQEAGMVTTTVVEWAPRLPVFGIYPTVQSLALQGLLVLLLVVAVASIVMRRRLSAFSRLPTAGR